MNNDFPKDFIPKQIIPDFPKQIIPDFPKQIIPDS